MDSEQNERERKDKDMKNSENIIKLFLIHEIKYNFNNVLQGKNTFYNRFKNEDEPKPFGYENDKIKVEEFNKI
ncbi:hypothetical protein KQI41_12205 [Tissierella pigra]|uniref:hypothetical protein n=1 Tax=Tissierella pigra TaxID=2607614 RepID=UPI001C1189E0|nr:hypothetical protein [Tissierella pigra]MBU5427179.1 hypothetical protein [Tissierella pigra]